MLPGLVGQWDSTAAGVVKGCLGRMLPETDMLIVM